MDGSFQISVVIALFLFQYYYTVSLVLSLSSMVEHSERIHLQQLQSQVAMLTAWMEDQRSKDQQLQQKFEKNHPQDYQVEKERQLTVKSSNHDLHFS